MCNKCLSHYLQLHTHDSCALHHRYFPVWGCQLIQHFVLCWHLPKVLCGCPDCLSELHAILYQVLSDSTRKMGNIRNFRLLLLHFQLQLLWSACQFLHRSEQNHWNHQMSFLGDWIVKLTVALSLTLHSSSARLCCMLRILSVSCSGTLPYWKCSYVQDRLTMSSHIQTNLQNRQLYTFEQAHVLLSIPHS